MSSGLKADEVRQGVPDRVPLVSVAPLRAALASIPDAIRYIGGPSRSKFYADVLPELEIVRLGGRTFVTLISLDRLIEAHRESPVRQPVGPVPKRARQLTSSGEPISDADCREASNGRG